MEQMISKLGFPIFCAVSAGGGMWFIVKYFIEKDKSNTENTNKIIKDMRADSKANMEMYRQELKETREQHIQELGKDRKVYVESIKSVVARVKNIEDAVEEIKEVIKGA